MTAEQDEISPDSRLESRVGVLAQMENCLCTRTPVADVQAHDRRVVLVVGIPP